MTKLKDMIAMAKVMKYDMNDIEIETDFDGGLGSNILIIIHMDNSHSR